MANKKSLLEGFRDLFQTRQGRSPEETAQLNLTTQQLQAVLGHLDLDLQEVQGGEVIVTPRGLTTKVSNDIDGFHQFWNDSAFVDSEREKLDDQLRKIRYRSYEFMDLNSTESSLTLDTYADEAIVSGLLDENPLKIKISDKEAEKKVLDILQKNEIISSADKPTITRSEIRELAKFGDRYYKLIKDGKKDNLKIVKIKHPHLISLLLDFPSLRTIGFRAKRDEFWPWEFVHMKIPDASFDPYGRSILEPMRAPFQQILINESLLALSRASKVERIVIRVPTTTKNPTSAFSSLMNARSILKNAIFGTSGSGKAKARVSGLTDILWLPSGQEYDIDKLQSSIDVTNIEDVEFFRDKFLTGTRLPKSFLLADDTDRLTEGVLSAQDLKFARALMPVQFGYTEGLTKLITMVLIVEGFDIEKISVEVSMRKPQAVMNSIIKNASESIGFVQEMIDSVARATGNEDGGVIGRKSWAKIMSTVTGLPVKFLNLFAKPEAPEVPVGTGTSDPEPPNNGGQEPEPPASDEEIVQSLLSDLLRSEITFTSKEILPSLGLTLDKAKGAQYDKRYEFLGESKKLYSVDKGKKNKYISRESREE